MWFLRGKLGDRFDKINKDDGLYSDVVGCNWALLSCTELYLAVLGCTGLYWAVLGCTGLY